MKRLVFNTQSNIQDEKDEEDLRKSEELFNAFKEHNKENISNFVSQKILGLPPKYLKNQLKRCNTEKGKLNKQRSFRRVNRQIEIEFKDKQRKISRRRSKLRA